ncbi:ATP-binding protein [uncultured Limosilactobacillus sp.]|uniref:ATP-binding protein n=1 Tax=uncultured Limosilactobacillus sp. TaxID=2837629 RepID=UPI0025D56B80|nr:ATP-binding protein [uncultured Limosilactobacillus sp.]
MSNEIKTTGNDINTNRINIIYNNQAKRMTLAQIFDAEKYPQFMGITGQISPEFLNRYLAKFVQVEVAMGSLPTRHHYTSMENVTKDALASALLNTANKASIKLFQSLSSQLQLAALAGVLKLEVAPTQVIHSRFYLLGNPATKETRVILGSADLTEPSFDANANRFEEIMIFDNSPLYNSLLKHFKEDLRPVLQPYFTNELLRVAEKQLKALKAAKGDNDNIIILSNDTTDEISRREMTNLIVDDVQHQIDKQHLSAGVTLAMRNVTDNRTQDQDREERAIKQRDTVLMLEKEAVSPRAARPKIKKREVVAENVKNAMAAAVSPQDLAVEKKYTTFLYDRPLERNIAHNKTGLYTPNDAGTFPIAFGKLATINQIRDGIHQIENVIKGYQQFVVDFTPEYGKRYYEAIMYAFTAPFLWEIRQRASLNPEDGNDIPNFLILGASAGSGKTTLLRIINQLTWNTDKSLIDFGTIYPTDTNQRKAKTMQALESYMKQGSSYPVLVDEIEPYFFQQPQYSRRLIVDTMNQLVNSPKPYAPLIGTTNYNSGFTMRRETARRTYYLQLDKVIDSEKKGVASKYIYGVRKDLNNTLFKDFVVRMANYLEDDSTPWRLFDHTTGQLDFLANTRKIFRDYYKLIDEPVPEYFSDGLSDDFGENARSKWSKLYLTQKDDFIYHEEKNSLLFDITRLTTFNGFEKDSIEEYRNALPVEICVDGINGKNGKFVELKAPAFYDWIGVANPQLQPEKAVEENQETVTEPVEEKPKKKGFWARLFG